MQGAGPKERVSSGKLGMGTCCLENGGQLMGAENEGQGPSAPPGQVGEKDIYLQYLIFLSQIRIPKPLLSSLLPQGPSVCGGGALRWVSLLMELSAAWTQPIGRKTVQRSVSVSVLHR